MKISKVDAVATVAGRLFQLGIVQVRSCTG